MDAAQQLTLNDAYGELAKGRLSIMGQIETVEPDGKYQMHKMALLIEFDSVEAIRKAMADGICQYDFA